MPSNATLMVMLLRTRERRMASRRADRRSARCQPATKTLACLQAGPVPGAQPARSPELALGIALRLWLASRTL